jgi:hypothetical protein
MRFITLLISLLMFGCVNVNAVSTSEALSRVDETSEIQAPILSETLISDAPAGLEIDQDLIDPPAGYFAECTCEYTAWRERGLMCLGLQCTPECSPEVTACNESRHACIAEM